jgi:alkane 1-monooxygenase
MSEAALEKPESWLWHLLGFVLPSIALAGNVLGEWWVLSGVVLAFGIYPILDWLLGEDHHRREVRTNGTPFVVLLVLHAFLVLPLVATVIWRGMEDGNAWTTWAAALSTGVAVGMSGIVVGHEMGHKKHKSARWYLGRMTLYLSLYPHFTTEHNHNHHRLVGMAEDGASAPKGRGLWTQFAITIPQQFMSAWRTQAERSKSVLHNSILHGLLIQFALIAAIFHFAGMWGLGAFLFQAALAIFLLEYVNYIRHYGLERSEGERQTEMHSWQSKKRLSRWVLIELTLHPAHHMKASTPFWQLQPYEGAPELPTGYFGMFWPSLIPPLWKRWMDPRIPEESSDSVN